ncbi:class I SAM-dependent methyltransferase [Rubrivirga sp.]|uniref:class I SAM-dependent methyltransferase n=1 Tax=Rubrivirga sp. TaxID=1885344 RepID=UPI003B52D7CF
MAPSDALLRTLAAVPPGVRVVDLACGAGRHLDPLARLGFDVWGAASNAGSVEAARQALAATLGAEEAARRVTQARSDALDTPDAWADWAVFSARDADGPVDLAAVFAEGARVLRPGGWIWAETEAAGGLEASAETAGLVVAQEPAEDDGWTHAIFRRPGDVG